MNSVLRVLVVTLCMALGTIASPAWRDQPDVINLEGPRSIEIDLNGDGVSDFVFANFTNTGTYRGANYGYSINVRDTRNSDLLHSVHVYNDGYTPDYYAEGRRVVTTSKGTPECALRAHFLVRNAEDDVYELLTASKKTNEYPSRLGTFEFTFHRLRTPESVGTPAYIYDGYRKTNSKAKYCDVVEAVTNEVFGELGGDNAALEPHDGRSSRVDDG